MEKEKNISPAKSSWLARLFYSLANWLSKEANYSEEPHDWNPHVNRVETRNAFLIIINLPHADRKSFVVRRHGDFLKVQGERKKDIVQEGRTEDETIPQDTGKFHLSFPLSSNADYSNIEASYVNGMLTIRIPKINICIPEGYSINVQ